MKKKLLIVLLAVGLLTIAIAPVVLAQPVDRYLPTIQEETNYGDSDLIKTVGRIIELVLGFLGLIALILFIVGGFKWMTSGGNEENIAEAKKLMSAAIVGLFIIFIAFAATRFIIGKIRETTGCTATHLLCTDDGGINSKTFITCDANEEWKGVVGTCPLGGAPATQTFCRVGTTAANNIALCNLTEE